MKNTNCGTLYSSPNNGVLLIQKSHLLLFIITVLAFAARVVWFPFVSRDYEIFLNPWYNEIQEFGGFKAIGRPIGDYLPSYIYILAALSYLPVNSLYSIKIVSFIGDIIMSYFSMKIVMGSANKRNLSYAIYAITLFLPTVMLNSGAWGQCDSLYTAGLIACLYYMLNGKSHKGMICYSISFIFKIQAVFFAPLILLLLIKKKSNGIKFFMFHLYT